MHRAVAVVLVALLHACSGRTIVERASGGAAGAAGAPGASCATPDGVRLCGANVCSWLGPDLCPGLGCAKLADRDTEAPVDAGVCLSDLPDGAVRARCGLCQDGEVCVDQAGIGLVCVPESVCASLWRLGARNVCRYADMSAYSGRPLAEPGSACPAPPSPSTAWYHLCGGECACARSNREVCTGRSAERRFGICVEQEGPARPCGATPGVGNDCWSVYPICGVFAVPDADRAASLAHGNCMDPDECRYYRDHEPGGMWCYGASGELLP